MPLWEFMGWLGCLFSSIKYRCRNYWRLVATQRNTKGLLNAATAPFGNCLTLSDEPQRRVLARRPSLSLRVYFCHAAYGGLGNCTNEQSVLLILFQKIQNVWLTKTTVSPWAESDRFNFSLRIPIPQRVWVAIKHLARLLHGEDVWQFFMFHTLI